MQNNELTVGQQRAVLGIKTLVMNISDSFYNSMLITRKEADDFQQNINAKAIADISTIDRAVEIRLIDYKRVYERAVICIEGLLIDYVVIMEDTDDVVLLTVKPFLALYRIDELIVDINELIKRPLYI